MSEQDKNEQTEVETIDTAGKETGEENHHKEDAYEKICSVCHRPESVAGKMIDLPGGFSVCSDCMQRSFDAMKNGQIDYSQLLNMPGVHFMNMADLEQAIPKQQKIKKKKEAKSTSRLLISARSRRRTRSRPAWTNMWWVRSTLKKPCPWLFTIIISGWRRTPWMILRLRSPIC